MVSVLTYTEVMNNKRLTKTLNSVLIKTSDERTELSGCMSMMWKY